MWTTEFEHDATIIRSLDESNKFEDVEVILGSDSHVFIRQFDDITEEHQVLLLSYQQLLDICASLHTTEGMFKIEVRKDDD